MEQKLTKVINRVLSNAGLTEIQSINTSSSLREDLELDSISIAELIATIDVEFGVDINSGNMIETVGDIVERLSKNH